MIKKITKHTHTKREKKTGERGNKDCSLVNSIAPMSMSWFNNCTMVK